MKNAKTDVVALGELLVDFTQSGISPQGNPLFEANPGGAPANVLAMLRKLGKSCAFIGKVGSDSFGNMLAQTLVDAGINATGLKRDAEIPTTLAVVSTLPDGDRVFGKLPRQFRGTRDPLHCRGQPFRVPDADQQSVFIAGRQADGNGLHQAGNPLFKPLLRILRSQVRPLQKLDILIRGHPFIPDTDIVSHAFFVPSDPC